MMSDDYKGLGYTLVSVHICLFFRLFVVTLWRINVFIGDMGCASAILCQAYNSLLL